MFMYLWISFAAGLLSGLVVGFFLRKRTTAWCGTCGQGLKCPSCTYYTVPWRGRAPVVKESAR